jgi:8-amino-7-oxononanoate synthase
MERIYKSLQKLKDDHLLRELKTVTSAQGSKVTIKGKEYILLSSNNYLGLASDERVVEAAKRGLSEFGFGSGASRLISGTMSPHVKLEEEICAFKGTEAAILFNSGYCANIGLISAITGKGDVILSDKLNHASIVDAALLSNAKVKRYPHKDTGALERFLKDSRGFSRRVIVTDGVFSMDGDLAPLKEIVSLAKRYDAFLIVDDAHATGVLGENGRGTLSHFGIDAGDVIQMGTLSKALGCFGAFVTGKSEIIRYLINKSRSFIYTTALPPSTAYAAIEAIRIAREGDDLRERLFSNVDFLRGKLTSAGFDVLNDETHIIPLIIGDVQKTLKLSEHLFDNGLFIQAIRPPTVPKDTCRLRITPTALHTKDELEYAFDKIMEFKGI